MTRTGEKVSLTLVVSALAIAIAIAGGAWNAINNVHDKLSDLNARVAVLEAQNRIFSARTGIKLPRTEATASKEDQ